MWWLTGGARSGLAAFTHDEPSKKLPARNVPGSAAILFVNGSNCPVWHQRAPDTPRRGEGCVVDGGSRRNSRMGTVVSASKEAMPDLKTRDEYIEYLDEVASGWRPKGSRRANLVKSYLVETSRHTDGMALSLSSAGLTVSRAGDSAMFRLRDSFGDVLAVMDNADTRFPVVHSTISADAADKVVRDSVMGSPHLDHVWLPGTFFDGLWNWTKTTSDPRRIAKLVFAFTGKYEQPGDEDDANDDIAPSDSDTLDFDAIEDDFVGETRRSQFAVEDRVEILDRKLLELKNTYDPLPKPLRFVAQRLGTPRGVGPGFVLRVSAGLPCNWVAPSDPPSMGRLGWGRSHCPSIVRFAQRVGKPRSRNSAAGPPVPNHPFGRVHTGPG